MPNVAPGNTQQLRFVLDPEAVRSNLVSLSVQQNGAPPATFDLPGDPALRSPALPAPDVSNAAFVPLKNVEVRLDKASPVPGGKFELFFTARNRSAALQYLGGSNLVFAGRSAAGQAIVSRRETFSIRGPRAAPTGMAPIQPGAAARLRVLFDAPTLVAPFTVTDGTLTATLVVPPAEEPDW
ncbi:hypothetical protein C7I55_11880 [Sphingomonas deserti]|uniref:Uncharacterized protein n=2 Tax=Allosphingosinicella deserti TaxID=2116704 RepID=A0A2P7QSL5_9SPHN|nr:hypothetical protein C7I55_11880 [Sphingomonas deserti]